MDKETYEALKRLMIIVKDNIRYKEETATGDTIKQVEDWVDEVAKEYCPDCGELGHRCKPE